MTDLSVSGTEEAEAPLFSEPARGQTRGFMRVASGLRFAANRSPPLSARASGKSNFYDEPDITRTSAPVVAMSSVTESPASFATNKAPPLTARATGSSNL